MSGWVKLHRNILDHWIFSFDEPDKALAWIYILTNANHSKSKFKIKNTLIDVNRGQLAVSQITLQKKFKWSQNKLKRFLKLLKNERMIDFETNALITIITVCNYNDYQSSEALAERTNERTDERANERSANELTNDIKECKEEKECKKHIYKSIDLSLLPKEITIEDQKSFIDYKVKLAAKQKKVAPTNRVILMSLNQAVKINTDMRIPFDEIFGTVEEKGWTGIKKEYFENSKPQRNFNQPARPASKPFPGINQ